MVFRCVIFFLCISLIRAKLVSLSCAEIRQFVDEHNSRRLAVASGQVSGQPAAVSMKAMIWDDELAAKAAKWADHNKFEHNPDRTVASKKFKTGENIYIYGTTSNRVNFTPKTAIDSWFNEYKYYTFDALTMGDFGKSPATGHYTQMLWANSNRLGCAMSRFKEGRFNKVLVVCNYGPAGNIIGRKMYEEGDGVSDLSCDESDCDNKYGDSC